MRALGLSECSVSIVEPLTEHPKKLSYYHEHDDGDVALYLIVTYYTSYFSLSLINAEYS
jgi:hypothetical protein